VLRPNAIVEKRLADIGSRVQFAPDPLPCTTPATPDAICACLEKTSEVDPGDRRCELTPTGLADFQLARFVTTTTFEEDVMVLGKSDAGWSVVARIASIYNPGAFGIYEEWELKEAKDERFGTRSIAKLVGHKGRNDSDMGINEVESEDTTTLLVCVRDNTGGPPACPLAVTTAYTYDRDILMEDPEVEASVDPTQHTKGLPIHDETKVSVELGADGVAKVRAVAGRPDAASLGDRRLW
jgi:hypothetical protein